MAFLTCAGATVLRGQISFPTDGCWSAELTLEADAAPDGAVQLEGPGLSLSGVVARGGSLHGRTTVRVAGARVAQTVPARPWQGAPLRLPLADVAAAIGAPLAADIAAAVLATRLDVWTRPEDAAARELDALAAVAGVLWRVRDDGSIWLGSDAWPAVEIDHRVIDVDEADRVRTIAIEDLSIRPGVVLDGFRIARATYRLDRERVRLDIHGEP